ncbi:MULTISPECIES: DUF4240 domain-containing protein [unclassified Streptomyces]|uniref:DUF4240 domain-containing protein n=1 Tax=unclassified Streptomyces TaxID=2593676 RepID=UPI0036813375
MNKRQFWRLTKAGRDQLLASRPVEETVAAEQALWDLMAESYTDPLGAAAHGANGGCSDDGFDYFCGRLITQGRGVFERVVPPTPLAELLIVQASAADGFDLESADRLGIAWNFDFGDLNEMTRILPGPATTHLEQRKRCPPRLPAHRRPSAQL